LSAGGKLQEKSLLSYPEMSLQFWAKHWCVTQGERSPAALQCRRRGRAIPQCVV